MNEKELTTTSERDRVSGQHVDVVFDTSVTLWSHVETLIGHSTLYDAGEDLLPRPLSECVLDLMRQDNDEIEAVGSFSFPANTLDSRESSLAWQVEVSACLQEALRECGVRLVNLPHQLDDFYAHFGHYLVRVQFSAERSNCSVTVNLEDAEDLAEERLSDLDELDNFDRLRNLIRIWSLAMDTTINQLGQRDGEHIQPVELVITAPESSNESDETNTTHHPSEHEYTLREGFDMLGGLTQAKERLMEIAAVYNDPAGAKLYGINRGNFVLHGQPGTGKTSLVKAFANEIDAELYHINTTDVIEKWVGASGRNMKDEFDRVKALSGNIVVFLDEFEAIAQKGHLGSSERTDVKKQLNMIIDDLKENYPNVIIAAATNADIDDLEPSLVRSGRIETIMVPKPNESERTDIWASILYQSLIEFGSQTELSFDEEGNETNTRFIPYDDSINPHELAQRTDDMTGADFELILQRARTRRFVHYKKTGTMTKISQQDLINEILAFWR